MNTEVSQEGERESGEQRKRRREDGRERRNTNNA
jgi:hypothetical protein